MSYIDLIPENTKSSLDAFAIHGRPMGDFCTAVMENDLMEAFGRADEENILAMLWIVSYVYNELPAPCHGSPEKVKAWADLHARERAEASL